MLFTVGRGHLDSYDSMALKLVTGKTGPHCTVLCDLGHIKFKTLCMLFQILRETRGETHLATSGSDAFFKLAKTIVAIIRKFAA